MTFVDDNMVYDNVKRLDISDNIYVSQHLIP